ncbi:MAG: PEGA domain protein [Methanoregulaceae archaeon PtaB.Bin056]|nr:MAG: PEGA domain protein [Methanoregulaceae archaeon PtaB.Bin056]
MTCTTQYPDKMCLLSFTVFFFFTCMVATTLLLPASAATTEIRVVKYAVDEVSILAEKTVGYRWMEQNLRVYGDGATHYYHQGPIFIDDPDPAKQEALRWNPAEDTNVQEKDMGAVKGTNLKDLCNLVGGMEPGDTLKIRSSDGWYKMLPYKNVYEYSSREGPIIICWNKDGKYPDTGYTDGMRIVWFADTSTNPWGIHAFGVWDWHEAADEKYWYYYQQGNEKYPTTTGLSGMYISEILIYSQDEPAGSIDVTSTPTGAEIIFDGDETGEVTPFTLKEIPAGSHTVSVRKEGYLSSDEEWVDVTHGMAIPVHFDLEREFSSATSGTSDATLPGGIRFDGEQGSLGVVMDGISGNVTMLAANGASQVCRSGQTLSYRIATDMLHASPSQWARLYVFSHRGYTSDHALEVRVNSVKAGIPDRSTYHHADGRVSETLAFNVTPMVQTTGAIEVSIRNPPGGNEWTVYPPVLLLLHHDGGEQTQKNWVAEGTGFIRAVEDYSVQDLENITITDFSDIQPGHSGAELVVIGTAPEISDTSFPIVLQNSVRIPGIHTHEKDGVWFCRFNVTSQLPGYVHTEFIWNAVDPMDQTEVAPRLAILSLSYPEKPATSEQGGGFSPPVSPTSPRPTDDGQHLSSPTPSVPTSPSPGVSAIHTGVVLQDESFLSRIWRTIFWIFGIPFPEYQTHAFVSGEEYSRDFDDRGGDAHSPDHLDPSLPSYPLNVTTTPPGAMLTVSGLAEISIAPATLLLPEGEYLLEAEMDGYLVNQTLVHITGPLEITLVLIPDDTAQKSDLAETPARSRHGGLLIVTYPGNLELSVDNKVMEGKSPLVLYGLKEGYHTVKATRPSATVGKGESIIARGWIHHDAMSMCELDFVSARLDRTIRITNLSGPPAAFTLNGFYPLLHTPVTIDVSRTGSFITLMGERTFTSVPIPDSMWDGSEFILPPYLGNYHTIAIESSPPGAEIFIDGARTGNITPSLVTGLSEGPHRVMVSLPGYIPAQRLISVPRTNEEVVKGTVSFILDTYAGGPLRVESIPNGAAIFLDGIATGEKTPSSFSGIPVGVHELTLKSGEITRSRDITIRPDNANRYVVVME